MGTVFNLLPISIINAIRDNKYSVIKDFVVRDKNCECVDSYGNTILILVIHAIFSEPENINDKTIQNILSYINNLLERPINVHAKNDWNESAKSTCEEYMKKCKKNKHAMDLLRAIVYHIKQTPLKTYVVVRQDSPYTIVKKESLPSKEIEKTSCEIL